MKRSDCISPEEVKEFRTRRGWEQADAAEWAAVSVRQWQRYESGESGVRKFLADRIRSRLARLRPDR